MVGAGARHSARTDKTLGRVRPVQKCWGSAGLDCGNFPVPDSWEPGGKYRSSPVILPEEIKCHHSTLKDHAAAEPDLFTAIRLNAQLQFRSAAQCPLAFSTS
jgi:hypothetical protein